MFDKNITGTSNNNGCISLCTSRLTPTQHSFKVRNLQSFDVLQKWYTVLY